MPSKVPKFTLRIDKEILAKMNYIASYNGRSTNKEIEQICKAHIKSFEDTYGTIPKEDLNYN